MKQYDDLLKHVQSLQEDVDKFYNKDNKAAGTRIRKGMQDLKDLAQKIRLEVLEKSKESTEKPAKKTEKSTAKTTKK